MRQIKEGLEESDRSSDDVLGCEGVWLVDTSDAVSMGIRAAEKEKLGVLLIRLIFGRSTH